jgi:GTPase SAR1 family protein
VAALFAVKKERADENISERTRGVAVRPISIPGHKDADFSLWDYAGQEQVRVLSVIACPRFVVYHLPLLQYYAGHEFFLDGANAVFVVVVRLDEVPDSGTKLAHWLRFIKSRLGKKPQSDDAKPTVILIGSSRDAVTDPSIARKQKEGWTSAWGQEQLAKVPHSSFPVATAFR